MKRWGASAASGARCRCYAHTGMARAKIASTWADRSRAPKTIAGIDRSRHQGQHGDERTKNKQAGFHLLSPSLLRLQSELDHAADGTLSAISVRRRDKSGKMSCFVDEKPIAIVAKILAYESLGAELELDQVVARYRHRCIDCSLTKIN